MLVRHQNFLAISIFFVISYVIIMAVGVSAIQTHAVHDILYNTLPMIYVVILLFLFSVSPKGSSLRMEYSKKRGFGDDEIPKK